jgi:hypothetical protein
MIFFVAEEFCQGNQARPAVCGAAALGSPVCGLLGRKALEPLDVTGGKLAEFISDDALTPDIKGANRA